MSVDLLTGARRWAAAALEANRAAGNPDVLGSDSAHDWWLFQDVVQVRYEGSGLVAAVLSLSNGSWQVPNPHNTMEFPRLRIDYFADPTRDGNLNVRIRDSKTKIRAAHDVLNRVFHSTGSEEMWWGQDLAATPPEQGVRVLGSQRQNEPIYIPVVDGDGAYMGTVDYGLTVG